MKERYIDTVAAAQGFHNAREKNYFSKEFHDKLMEMIYFISFPCTNGRKICKYNEFLCRLAFIEAKDLELQELWKNLGHWLAEGIGVARDAKPRE